MDGDAAMMTLAALQMNSGAEPAANLETVRSACQQAVAKGVQLIVLPENFAAMGASQMALAEQLGTGPLQDGIADLACEFNLWVVAGTLPIASPEAGRAYAASIVFDSSGQRRAVYNKIHLFDVELANGEQYRESDRFYPGDTAVLLRTPFGNLGLTICYDLRFPQLFQQLAAAGADIITVPSAFTAQTGAVHWEALLRARAIENQCYIIAANQCGQHVDGRRSWGHSMIIDPWGTVIAAAAEAPGIISADYDVTLLQQTRRSIPLRQHQRPDSGLQVIDLRE